MTIAPRQVLDVSILKSWIKKGCRDTVFPGAVELLVLVIVTVVGTISLLTSAVLLLHMEDIIACQITWDQSETASRQIVLGMAIDNYNLNLIRVYSYFSLLFVFLNTIKAFFTATIVVKYTTNIRQVDTQQISPLQP